MRPGAGAAAIATVLHLLPGAPAVVTVAQQDGARAYLDSPSIAVSANGRFVAFTSRARLVPADEDAAPDVYVLDRVTGEVTLESLLPPGCVAPADFFHPGISADGRLVVYESLVATNEHPDPLGDVVLRDRQEATSRTLSRRFAGAVRDESGPCRANVPDGRSSSPAVSADGSVVAFVSGATNLVETADANGGREDVYLVDVRRGGVRRVSVDRAGVQSAAGVSVAPSVSGDGRYVAFASTARLDASVPLPAQHRGARPFSQIYVRDTSSNITKLVSVARGREPPDGPSWRPAISADGRSVAFQSAATNLVANDRNGVADVFVVDLRTDAVELVSRSARNGSANGRSGHPVVSADGRFVAFQSEASDLLCAARCAGTLEDINLLWDVFLFDRQRRTLTQVSVDLAGGWMEASVGPALDGAGSVVAFSSRHPIDAADVRNDFDLFVVRVANAKTPH